MIFKGKTKVEGNKIGTVCILVSNKELLKYKGGQVKYELNIYKETQQQKKAESHKIAYVGFNKGKHLFKVISGESGDKYLVDISFGCGCDFGGKKGIARGKMCSHIRSVLRKISI